MPRIAKRSVVVSVRMTVAEEQHLQRLAKIVGLTPSIVIRQALELYGVRFEKKAS